MTGAPAEGVSASSTVRAVCPTAPTAPASSHDRFAGLWMTRSGDETNQVGVRARRAEPDDLVADRDALVPAPSSITTPANSVPGTKGAPPPNDRSGWSRRRGSPQRVRTAILRVPGARRPTGSSSTLNTSGEPNLRATAAR